MISLAAYRVLHVLGMALVFTALGGLLAAAGDNAARKRAGMLHGIGLVIILVTGFGALARLGLSNPAIWPLWLWAKAIVWLALGAVLVLIRRAPQLRGALWVILPLLGALGAYLAIYKPS